MKRCNSCDQPIPPARLEALPSAEYCVECADNHTPIKRGLMDYSHKTAGEVMFIDGRHNWNRADAVYRRKR